VRPHKSLDPSFVHRLEEISGGSRASLAKEAGLSPSTFQNLFTGSEPTRRILIAIARAAGVSVQWLACGDGPKKASFWTDPPQGYEFVPFFNVPLLGPFEKPEHIIFKRSWLAAAGVRESDQVFAIEAPDDSMSHRGIFTGSIVIANGSHKLISVGRPAGRWEGMNNAIYAIAVGIQLRLRRVFVEPKEGRYCLYQRKGRAGASVDARRQIGLPSKDEELELAITRDAPDFRVLGIVAWVGGALAPGWGATEPEGAPPRK
jgi:lambda repressor-like predicted transcriptional regulator